MAHTHINTKTVHSDVVKISYRIPQRTAQLKLNDKGGHRLYVHVPRCILNVDDNMYMYHAAL